MKRLEEQFAALIQKTAVEAPSAGTSVYHNDPCMERIVEVLDQLHQVCLASNSKLHGSLCLLSSRWQGVISNVRDKSESVRPEARVGQDETLRRAADNLHSIRLVPFIRFENA